MILPLSRPALATVAILSGLAAWNDFLDPPVYLNDEKKHTLALGLAEFAGLYSNAFEMNCLRHLCGGFWAHPRDGSEGYRTLDCWINLAKMLEAVLIDAVFLADVLGLYDVYRGGPEAALRYATQVPKNDPLLIIRRWLR